MTWFFLQGPTLAQLKEGGQLEIALKNKYGNDIRMSAMSAVKEPFLPN